MNQYVGMLWGILGSFAAVFFLFAFLLSFDPNVDDFYKGFEGMFALMGYTLLTCAAIFTLPLYLITHKKSN